MSLPLAIFLILCAGVAGLLVGRKNPSLASAAAALVKEGELKYQDLLAKAKAKLALK